MNSPLHKSIKAVGSDGMVGSRHVFHLSGYDPVDAARHYRRFARQVEIFERTWAVKSRLSDLALFDEPWRASWQINSHTAAWQVDAVHELLSWDDFVRDDRKRSLLEYLSKASAAYFDFIVSGTMRRIFVANWRYGIFFLYPVLMLLVLAVCDWLVVRQLIAWSRLDGIEAILVGLPLGIALYGGLLRLIGTRWQILHLLNLWSFANDYVHRRRAAFDARLDQFAKRLIACARSGAADEIVVVGHSFGAMLALDVVSRALSRDPDFVRCGPAVCVLTVGSTIPKFTLHRRGAYLRDAIARVAAEPSITWAEIHSRDDYISCYGVDPVTSARLSRNRRIGGHRLDGIPSVRRIQIHDMVGPETFARHRLDPMRLHYQTVMANEKRTPYDYMVLVCGPVAFARWAAAARGLLDCMPADDHPVETARHDRPPTDQQLASHPG